MTTAAPRARVAGRAADLVVSIILVIVGFVVLVVEGILDILLVFTSADAPGDVEGAESFAFALLWIGGAVWLVASTLVIVFMLRRHTAWWLALIAIVVPIACTVVGFLDVTSMVP